MALCNVIFNVLLLLVGCGVCVNARVIGIDIGSQSVTAVMVRPGRPFQIVLDETTKRNAPVLVAFDKFERRFGTSASRFSTRHPQRSFVCMTRLLGKKFNAPEMHAMKAQYKIYDFVETERGTIAVRFEDVNYTVEEIVAMTLRYVKKMAEISLNEDIKLKKKDLTIDDAVLSVPVHFNPFERQALHDAAEIAGFRVLALINDNNAAAVQLGISQIHNASLSKTIGIFNMGAMTTSLTFFKYSAYVHMTGIRTNTTVGQVEVLGTASNSDLGGSHFDSLLLEKFSDEFQSQLKNIGNEDDVRELPRVMARLRESAKKTKEILSANEKFPVSIESLHEDLNFHSRVSRNDIVELGSNLFERVSTVVQSALKNAQVLAEKIDSIIMIGGGSRMPKVKEVLKESLNRNEIEGGLDADECVAFGSAFIAANHSISFRVRKFGYIPRVQFPVSVRLTNVEHEDNSEDEKNWTKRASLFTKKSVAGTTRYLTIDHEKDVVATLHCDDDKLMQSVSSGELMVFQVTGIPHAVAELQPKGKPKIRLSFKSSSDGRVSLAGAEVIAEETLLVPDPAASKKSSKSDKSSKQSKTSDKTISDDAKTEAQKEDGNDDDKTEDTPKMKEVKRKHRLPLVFTTLPGQWSYMQSHHIAASREVLKRLDEADQNTRDFNDGSNKLETFIYETRNQLRKEAILSVCQVVTRDSILVKLEESLEWLENYDGEKTPTLFLERLSLHQSETDAIFNRLREAEARPQALIDADIAFVKCTEQIKRMRSSMTWIPVEQVDKLAAMLSESKEWLSEVQQKQSVLQGHEEPAYRVKSVLKKVNALVKLAERLLSLPKPAPPKVKDIKNGTEQVDDDKTKDATPSKAAAVDTESDTEAPTSSSEAEDTSDLGGESEASSSADTELHDDKSEL